MIDLPLSDHALVIIVALAFLAGVVTTVIFGAVARYGASDATTPGEPENGTTDRRGGTRGYVVGGEE